MIYKEQVIKRVKEEYEKYKEYMLSFSPEEVFDQNFEIYAKTQFKESIIHESLDIFSETDLTTEKRYKVLMDIEGEILSALYNYYLNIEVASFDTWDTTAEIIKDYIDDVLSKSRSIPVYRINLADIK